MCDDDGSDVAELMHMMLPVTRVLDDDDHDNPVWADDALMLEMLMAMLILAMGKLKQTLSL